MHRLTIRAVTAMLISVALTFAGISTIGIVTRPARATAATVAADPSDPSVVYAENFENVPSGTTLPTLLKNYSSTSGHAYSADQYWLEPAVCNGFIVDADKTDNSGVTANLIRNTYCGNNGSGIYDGDYAAVRAKAYALGALHGLNDPSKNHALSTNTSSGSVATLRNNPYMFELLGYTLPSSVTTGGRYIDFSVDSAATNCTNAPLLQFIMTVHYTDGTKSAIPLNNSAINVCDTSNLSGGTTMTVPNQYTATTYTGTEPTWVSDVTYGTLYGSQSLYLGSASKTIANVDLQLKNTSTASSGITRANLTPAAAVQYGVNSSDANGNDGAIDNIRIVDVTPYLTKSFDPTVTSVGSTSRLTLTAHNRSDNGEKDGWSFTDNLPAGLTIAQNPNLTSSCTAAISDVKAVAGDSSITVQPGAGKLAGDKAGNALTTCSIQVNVTSKNNAVYTNGTGAADGSGISNMVGIDFVKPDAQVKFVKGSVAWGKTGKNNGKDNMPLAGTSWTITRTSADGDKMEAAGNPNYNSNTIFPIGCSVDIADNKSGILSCPQGSNPATTWTDSDTRDGYFNIQNLPLGTYSVTEKDAPDGYQTNNTTYTFDIKAVANGQPITVSSTEVPLAVADAASVTGTGISNSTIVNYAKLGTVNWNKSDSSANKVLLAGSKWRILMNNPSDSNPNPTVAKDANGNALADITECGPNNAATSCVGYQQGVFKVSNLAWGTYYLQESQAPAGYTVNQTAYPFTIDAAHLNVSVGTDGSTSSGQAAPIENKQANVPELPLTGGQGAYLYVWSGLAAVFLATLLFGASETKKFKH